MRAMPIVLAMAACGSTQGLPPDWIGTDDALRSGVMTGEPGAGVPREAVQDDALLAYLEGSTACFDVIVRTAEDEDRGLALLQGACTSGEGSSPTEMTADEIVSVYDYAENGEVASVVSEETSAESWGDSQADPPASSHTRVVERKSRLCCQVGLADTIGLSLGTLHLSWDMR